MNQYLLGIDIGTSACKIAIFDEDGQVKVYVEKPDAADCFHSATCWLPSYRWESVTGFSQEELARYEDVIRSTAHLILRFAQEGGFDSAANL